MKSRLHKIEIRNFKAFRDFTFDLAGRHLLVYGANGSGKSSLYWALYTFLQSTRKATSEVAKYFEPGGKETLLNSFEQAEVTPKPGEIALTMRDTATEADTTFRINHTKHGTLKQPLIEKGDLASDFITYRFFFGFSHFRNSERFDLWPLFEKEMLPFCRVTSGKIPFSMWDRIRSGDANPRRSRGTGGTRAYQQFKRDVDEFAVTLQTIVAEINIAAQKFYDANFAADDAKTIELQFGVTVRPDFNIPARLFTKPQIGFAIKVGTEIINRPQVFLNEAKLTQLALSVRFGAAQVKLHDSDLKLLVLDDLLVSLDMSNRMKVVEILLSATFDNYQKILLTHDYGFFREFARTIGSSHSDWLIVALQGTPATCISCQVEKTELQKAEEYLHGHNLDEAAICLRKATEDTVTRYLKPTVVPTKDFVTLSANLRAARNKLLEKLPTQLYDKVLNETAEAHRGHLISVSDDDVDSIPGLGQADRDALKHQRKQLRKLLTDAHWKAIENAKLIDEVLKTTERVLNPGAHGGQNPLYRAEVQKALDLIAKLEKCLA
jgi:ABC-type multidrug transport system ATPase subunit